MTESSTLIAPSTAARSSCERQTPLRIGIYTPSYPGFNQEGGIGTYTRNLAHGLAQLGHAVHVLTSGDGASVCDGPVTVHSVATTYMRGFDRIMPGFGPCWRVARAMQSLAQRRQLDVMEFPNWQGFGALLHKRSMPPLVVRLHTSARESQQIDQLPPSRELAWDVRRERWQVRRAAALVTHSAAHRRAMAEELRIAEDRIGIVPHGVEVFPEYEPPPRPAGPPRIVFLGRLEKRKGALDLLHAARLVLKQIPQATFTLIGNDRAHCPQGRTHAQYLAAEFTSHEQEQIRLAGTLPQADVDRALQNCDVFVAPSLYESFGLIIPEALRWGAPVVATRVGGIPEIITHEETGLLVEPARPDQLAADILRLLTNASLAQRLGTAGKRRVEECFSVARMAQAMARFYRLVVKGHS